jgi:20S proteasome subunit beta 4
MQEGMTLAEGLDLMRKCIHELQTRFLINQKVFLIKVVDEAGARIVDLFAKDE